MWNCSLFNYSSDDLNKKYQDIIIDIRVSVACFSLIGSLFVIGLIWLFKKYKFYIQRLILYLSISAFLNSTAYILGRVDFNPNSDVLMKFCVFEGFWLLFTDWTVLLSVFCITFNLLLTSFTEIRVARIELLYLGIIFLLPIPISCIPFINDSFGPSGAWCWIRGLFDDCSIDNSGMYLQFGVWYIPQYLLIILLFVMYFIVAIKVNIKTRAWQGTYDPNVERKKQLLKEEVKPLLWYPTVYFAVCVFPLINRVVLHAGHDPIFGLYVVHVICSPLPGALTALTYALDRHTLKRLRWSTVKASLLYRNTNVVREYAVGPLTDEKDPLLQNPLRLK